MIEEHLRPGALLQWNGPRNGGEPSDGEVTQNPCFGKAPLSLLGYDSTYAERAAPTSAGDDDVFELSHKWLCYNPGRSTQVKLERKDVLTGWMSGCLICIFSDEHGNRSVAHVGTYENMKDLNKKVKKRFREYLPQQFNMKGYSPAEDFPHPRIFKNHDEAKSIKTEVLSLVTLKEEFFSILIMPTKRTKKSFVAPGWTNNAQSTTSTSTSLAKNADYIVLDIKKSKGAKHGDEFMKLLA